MNVIGPMSRLSLLLLLPLLVAACSPHSGDPSAFGRRFMVSTARPEATAAGVEILRDGGNAVDAAVAIGFALAVAYPEAGNLGGGGFMVIRMADGRTTTIDFREVAPRNAKRDMFLDNEGELVPERSTAGPLAAGVPGSPAGLLYALDKYGTLDRKRVLEPAIRLAGDGIVVGEELAADLNDKLHSLAGIASTSAVWLNGHYPPRSTDTIRQKDLQATLQRVSDSGREGFYGGETARLIVEYMKEQGGIIDSVDLALYRPVEREPVIGTYRGATVISMPPPSSGGVLLIEMLNMLAGYDFSQIAWHSSQHAHILVEVMRRAYADRAEFLGDPDFYPVPTDVLLSTAYADKRRSTIGGRATPSASITHGEISIPWREGTETTHYSVADSYGNVVAVTTTLNGYFGNKMIVDGAGFFLNNEMDDFSAKPGTRNMFDLVGATANEIAPGKRMLSSMTPTIVLRENKPWLVVGTPGGSTIITTVLQVIHAQIDYGMPLHQAIQEPRIHHQWIPDSIMFESGAFTQETIVQLTSLGYTPVRRIGSSGRVDAIRIDWNGDYRILRGWSDRRGAGRAAGE